MVVMGHILPEIPCVKATKAKKHEKLECSCFETKNLGSPIPKSNKERALVRNM